jgi:predicted MFS family arabinose efflux permease
VSEWRRGWTLVLAASVGFSFFAVMSATNGVFMAPLEKEFGWDRTMQSSGTSIASLFTALLSPFFGVLIDRIGTRRLALPGLVGSILVIAAIAQANGVKWQWFALWSLFGLISLTVKSTVWTAAVAGMFEKGRGLALGLTLSGTAVATSVAPPLANWLIENHGWRWAMTAMALGWGGLALLLCVPFMYDAHDYRKRAASGSVAAMPLPDASGLSIPQALRDSALWRIALTTFVMMVLTIGLQSNLQRMLTDQGFSSTNAAWASSIMGVTGVIGKLVTGQLLDRFRPNRVGGITLAITAIAFWLLYAMIDSVAAVLVAIAVNGYAAGTKIQIAGFLTTRYGGIRNFGAIFGMMASLIAIGSGLGGFAIGQVFDRTGSYELFFLAGIVGSLACGLVIMGLPLYPKWQIPPRAEGLSAPEPA